MIMILIRKSERLSSWLEPFSSPNLARHPPAAGALLPGVQEQEQALCGLGAVVSRQKDPQRVAMEGAAEDKVQAPGCLAQKEDQDSGHLTRTAAHDTKSYDADEK
jgi:hypothetical protein